MRTTAPNQLRFLPCVQKQESSSDEDSSDEESSDEVSWMLCRVPHFRGEHLGEREHSGGLECGGDYPVFWIFLPSLA